MPIQEIQTLEQIIELGSTRGRLQRLYLAGKRKQPAKPTNTRKEQLTLMENTLESLQIHPIYSQYSIEDKAKIIKGLMLVIDYQMIAESNIKSHLQAMIRTFLNAKIDANAPNGRTINDAFGAIESVLAFEDFSKKGIKVSDRVAAANHMAVEGILYYRSYFDLLEKEISKIERSLSTMKKQLKTHKMSSAQKRELDELKTERTIQQDNFYDLIGTSSVSFKFSNNILTFTSTFPSGSTAHRNIDYASDYAQKLSDCTVSLRSAMSTFREAPITSASRANLLFQLKKSEIELENIRYCIEIAGRCVLYGKPTDTTEWRELKKCILAQRDNFEALNGLCTEVTNQIRNKLSESELESKTTAETTPKNKLVFFSRNPFNKSNPEREKIKEILSTLRNKINLSDDVRKNLALIPKPSTETNLARVKSPETILAIAEKHYNGMSQKKLTKNLSFEAIKDLTEQLTTHMNSSSLLNDVKSQQISLLALDYLIKIAQLKVNAPRILNMHVSDSQVRKLEALFSAFKPILEELNKLREPQPRPQNKI